MKKLTLIALVAAVFSVGAYAQETLPQQAGSASQSDFEPFELEGKYYDARYLPERIRDVARGSKLGIHLDKARRSWETDEGVYTIIGRLPGEVWRIKVTGSAELLSVHRDS